MDNEVGLKEFIAGIKKVNESRVHKITDCYGVYDVFKWVRKNKWLNIGRPLTEHEFYSIIRRVNNYMAEELIKGNDITLPCRMGKLEVRKFKASIKLVDGKIKTNLPINWDKTLELWYNDSEAFTNKTLIRIEANEIFKFYYNKSSANYANKSFYEFTINRDIKQSLKKQIRNGKLDAFNF